MHTSHRVSLFIGVALTVAGSALADDWPKDYIVAEHSQSPDGRFGILIESKDAVLKREEGPDDNQDYVNYLADLKTHQTLGKIAGSNYFENQNHRGLNVKWSPDSKLCVATYWARFGFDSIQVLEPVEQKFKQVEIGDYVEKISNAAIRTSSGQIHVDIAPHFRIESSGVIHIQAVGMSNPKQLDDVKTYYTYFRGAYNYPAKQWVKAEAKTITNELSDQLDSALVEAPEKSIFVNANVPSDFEGVLVQSEAEKTQSLDRMLNDVYQALRTLLPAAQFAKLRTEQKEWVTKLEATPSDVEKSKLLAERIKTLQDLLWQ